MIGTCYGAVADGLEATVVKVEADVGRGLPQFSIVGLPDSAVSESKLRIRSALHNAGLEFPKGKITVNLSPASLRKRGAGLDLAIAVAILRSVGIVPHHSGADIGFCGELSLSGSLVPVRGILNLALAFQKQAITDVVIAADQTKDCVPIPQISWFPFSALLDVVNFLFTPNRAQHSNSVTVAQQVFFETPESDNFSEVVGLEEAKRALTIAAAGRHHVLLVGPPGSGKSMLSERFPSILPPLTQHEALDVYAIHQASGLLTPPSLTPVLRNPHHTLTSAGLIGGGNPLSAGEVTLAHHGVLLLDELLEFQRTTLDALREPLVTKQVRLSRAGHSIVMPADFILVGTLNPCPCGQRGFGDCRCTDGMVSRYWSRLSGALIDRIELIVHVQPQTHQRSALRAKALPSAVIRQQVMMAHQALVASAAAYETPQRIQTTVLNSALVQPKAKQLLELAEQKLHLSSRAISAVHRVAHTISLLDQQETIGARQVEEALAFRSPIQMFI